MQESPAVNDNVPFEVSVEEVKQWLDQGEPLLLIDCRQPDEHAIASIGPARLIPMSEIAGRLPELAPGRTQRLVIHCHHGGRSQRVTAWLREQGFAHAQNMAGGIDAWSERVDTQVPRY